MVKPTGVALTEAVSDTILSVWLFSTKYDVPPAEGATKVVLPMRVSSSVFNVITTSPVAAVTFILTQLDKLKLSPFAVVDKFASAPFIFKIISPSPYIACLAKERISPKDFLLASSFSCIFLRFEEFKFL
jgi:hypothetical protein